MKKISMAVMAAMVTFSGAAVAQAPAAPAKAEAKKEAAPAKDAKKDAAPAKDAAPVKK